MSFSVFGTTGSLSSKNTSTDLPTNPSEVSSSSGFASSSDLPNFFATPKVLSTTSDISTKTIPPFSPSTSIFGGHGDGGKPLLSAPATGSNTNEAGGKTDASKEPAKTFTISLFGGSMSGNASSSPTGGTFSSEQPITGSIGNPVGFGFGALAPKASDSGPAGSSSPSPAVSPPPTEKSGESTPPPEGNEETPPAEDDAVKSLTTGSHDEEGEGEEDEETMHAVKCKVFRLTKTDGKDEWKELGIGKYASFEKTQRKQRPTCPHAKQPHRKSPHCQCSLR
ncbi:hypothetical protein EDC04DRAFT_2567179 [Pisolithus marmoratus]|nr:hypothetical protein EDC04DRAFT_2567179 [Pisolithus marmoratus]